MDRKDWLEDEEVLQEPIRRLRALLAEERSPELRRQRLMAEFDRLHRRQFGRFHDLADRAVSDDHACGAVAFREVKGKNRHVDGLLYRRGGQHNRVVVAMSTAMDGLVVVAL